MDTTKKYVPLDEHYRWLFEAGGLLDESVLTEDDMKNIRPFSKEYSAKYWTDNIFSGPDLYQMGWEKQGTIDHWICSLKEADYNWLDDWNNDNFKGLPDFLSGIIDLPNDERIVYFWHQYMGLETTWGIFKKNWISFLFDDESPILLSPRTGFAIRFSSANTLYTGYKNEPVIE